jgi:hypothetical protein
MVASSFKRDIKGGDLGLKIFSDSRLAKYSKVVVGDDNEIFESVANITRYPLILNAKVKEIMGTVKILIVPSVFEASPNVQVEAECCGARVLSSLNIGNAEYFNDMYLVSDRDCVDEWVTSLLKILELDGVPPPLQEHEQNIDYCFLDILHKWSDSGV